MAALAWYGPPPVDHPSARSATADAARVLAGVLDVFGSTLDTHAGGFRTSDGGVYAGITRIITTSLATTRRWGGAPGRGGDPATPSLPRGSESGAVLGTRVDAEVRAWVAAGAPRDVAAAFSGGSAPHPWTLLAAAKLAELHLLPVATQVGVASSKWCAGTNIDLVCLRGEGCPVPNTPAAKPGHMKKLAAFPWILVELKCGPLGAFRAAKGALGGPLTGAKVPCSPLNSALVQATFAGVLARAGLGLAGDSIVMRVHGGVEKPVSWFAAPPWLRMRWTAVATDLAATGAKLARCRVIVRPTKAGGGGGGGAAAATKPKPKPKATAKAAAKPKPKPKPKPKAVIKPAAAAKASKVTGKKRSRTTAAGADPLTAFLADLTTLARDATRAVKRRKS